MALPFSQEEYFGSISSYNLDVWPAHAVIYLVAFCILALAYKGRRSANLLLAFLWVWAGSAYFIRHVGPMSPAGYAEAAVLMIQAFLVLGIQFSPRKGWLPSAGGVLIFYAMVAYPMLGAFRGQGLQEVQYLGLHAPTTIFTLGLIMWAGNLVPGRVLVIPLMMALGSTIIGLYTGVYENLGLLVAGVLAVLWLNKYKPESPVKRLMEEA
jgi:hypothetical protein